MSATTPPRSTDESLSNAAASNEEPEPNSTEPRSKEERLAMYLRERAEAGDMYFKSKFIADDVNLSSKEIGALIVKLQESVEDLSIERWSYTGATTWRVERTA